MGNANSVRRRAFIRSGYSNASFGGGGKDDVDSDADTVDQRPNPAEVRKKKSGRYRSRFVRWSFKNAPKSAACTNRASEDGRVHCPTTTAVAVDVRVLQTYPESSRNCVCQSKDCFICGVNVEPAPPSGRTKRKSIVNINTCTVFDLAALDGIDQTIATNVVIYREKKGPFKQLDRLLKVPGVTKSVYCRIAPYVTVVSLEDDDSSGLHINEVGAVDSNNGYGKVGNFHSRNVKNNCHSRQSSAFSSLKSSAADESLDLLLRMPVDTDGGKDLEQANIDLIYRLMCSKSERPKIKEDSDKGADRDPSSEQQRSHLRLACWDLEGCTFDKANNPGVLEVICMTILENGWNFIILTDFTSDHVLDRLVMELNFPTLHKVKMWRQSCKLTPQFDCVSFCCPETVCYSGYLFAIPSVILERTCVPTLTFKIGCTSIAFQCSTEDDGRDDNACSLDKDVVRVQKCIKDLSASGNILCFGQYVVGWSSSLESKLTGRAGMVEDGLTHLAIPNGWTLGGRVTRSSPVWIELVLNGERGSNV